MRRRILTAEHAHVEELTRALSSPVRRRMLNALALQERSIQELADHLGIPQSSCTVNIQTLAQVGLVTTRNEPGEKGSRKICSVAYDEIIIPVHGDRPAVDSSSFVVEMPIGLYTDYNVRAPCGIVSDSSVIGQFDRVESFVDPHRATAQLIWFTDGWVEYSFPLDIPATRRVLSVSLSMEICSEFPGYKNTWPSDITVWIAGHQIGTWR
ncbi:MAG: helix-turn-helix domain-containing protein, partial [Alkalispirochaeta sp.]